MQNVKSAAKCTVLAAAILILAGCSTFYKAPVFPASQYDIKTEHGLVLTEVGNKWFSGKNKSWLEICDYRLDRKPDEPFVIFPDYLFLNCVQHGPVHTH